MNENETIEYLKQTLRDIRDGKDNPCHLVEVALERTNEVY